MFPPAIASITVNGAYHRLLRQEAAHYSLVCVVISVGK